MATSPEPTIAPVGSSHLWVSELSAPRLTMDAAPAHATSWRAASTIPAALRATAERFPTAPAMRCDRRRDGSWTTTTWGTYLSEVRRVAKSLIHLGCAPFATVGIMGVNRPEWALACVGAITAGCVSVGIYPTNGDTACEHVARHANLSVVVCETRAQCDMFARLQARLPHLTTIVRYGDDGRGHQPGVMTWREFVACGASVPRHVVDDRCAQQRPEHCCSLIYTSGTTGMPKGVMISHDNITWTASTVLDVFAASAADRLVSYLPLSHIAAAMLDVYGPVIVGYCVYYADRDALKGTLVHTLKAVRPTVFFGVPRVFEKIRDRMLAFGASKPWPVRCVSAWAKRTGLAASAAEERGEPLPWGFALASVLVFRNVRRALGLDQCRGMFSGAAAMRPDVLQYFRSLHMQVHELYGMSECTGPQNANLPHQYSSGTCGMPLPGTELRLDSVDSSGVGEVCVRGRHVFMGYLRDPDATAAVIDAHGWLHSGDLGSVDPRGFLTITGRRKELLVTAGGENVAPLLIEDAIKAELPVVSHAVVVGHGNNFLAALLTLKCVTVASDKGDAPTDEPDPAVLAAATACGSCATTVPALSHCPALSEVMRQGLQRANARAVSKAQCVHRFMVLPRDFSVPTGELTPTLKLRRNHVDRVYEDVIAAVCNSTAGHDVSPPRGTASPSSVVVL